MTPMSRRAAYHSETMATGSISVLSVVLLATIAVLLSPALSAPVYGDEDALSSCPPLHDIVRSTVRAALRQETALAAGLLRIFFHDCFPNGCDASILLLRPRDGAAETSLGPNLTIQRRAMQLIEDIRDEVHFACGPTVSCADITALATRAAVVASGGPSYALPKGQLDSFFPAPQEAVFQLPDPSTASVATLLQAFASRGLGDPADLVALSGGHTIGRTQCSFFADRSARMEDTFSRKLAANCSKYPDRLQNLDVVTPDLFDNGFFKALTFNQGVFTSDMALVKDRTTAPTVRLFARDNDAFFSQFATSMEKLARAPRPAGNRGEIRRFSCFRTNAQRVISENGAGDEEEDEQGFAASA